MSDDELTRDDMREAFMRDPIGSYKRWYERVRDHIAAEGFTPDHVWGSFTYGCVDDAKPARPVPPGVDLDAKPDWIKIDEDGNIAATPPGCGFRRRVQMGVGVEGPPGWKEADHTIPSPFVAGRCPACGLPLSHCDWRKDEKHEVREREPSEATMPLFRVPSLEKGVEYAEMNYGGAELVEPEAVDAAA